MMGNNFKMRSVLIPFVVSSIFILANFVSAATYDATGGWFLSVSNGWTDGGVDCPLEEGTTTIPATINQIGDNVTLVVHEYAVDKTYNGTVIDNNYNLTAFWILDGDEVTVQVTFTLLSSTSGTGQVVISIFDPVAETTCEKGMDITLTKQGAAPTYDGTGEWKYSTSNIFTGSEPGCNPVDPVISTATVTQIVNNVTLVAHDPEGDITFTGSASGDIYSLTTTFPEDGGTMTINMIFTLSSINSGTGKVRYTWTNGVNTCTGGFDITFTKQQPVVPTGDGGGGGCFIATAAYGSIMEPRVKILRNFRDRFLLHNSIGKSFVRLYNTYSPPMADFIAKHDSLRAMVRISLLPVVGISWITLKIGPVSTVALMLLFISCFVGLVWFRRRYKE